MKETAQKIKSEIDKAKHILLHCHPSPDPDSVGSALAMKLGLEQLGKKVTLIKGDSEIPGSFDFPGIATIVQKNLFEIDLKDFDLFIILDSGSIEKVSTEGKVVFPDSLMTIVIDHHISNIGYGKLNLVEPKYSATAELLFDLFKEIGIKIDHDIALNLFMGIYTDTGGFRYSAATRSGPDTLKTASELASLAPDYQKTIATMENSNSLEALVFESLALSSLKMYFDGKFALSYVSHADILKNKIGEHDRSTGHISNRIKSIAGVCLSATLVEVEPNLIKMSFRSNDPSHYDVSTIVVALGGGGHRAAAGAKIKSSMKDAIDTVVKKVKEIYNI